MSNGVPMISIVIPTYNEEKRLVPTVETVLRWLDSEKVSGEILVADDVSTDGTRELIGQLCKKDARIRKLFNQIRLGKGATFMAALPLTRGAHVVYLDADMATNSSSLRPLLDRARKGCAIVTGSRYHPASQIQREPFRNATSRIYNLLLRLLFFSSIRDHQCGFKVFQKSKILPLLPRLRSRHWFWDAEILIKAQKNGLVVDEIPIEWTEVKGGKFSVLRDSLEMAGGIAALWMDIYVKKFY